jgi:hypothetical protein
MKKIMFVVINLIVTIITVVAIIFIYNNYYKKNEVTTQNNNTKFAGLEKELTDLEKDIDFYRNMDNYKYLLSKEELDILDKKIDEAEEDEEFENFAIIFYTSYFSKQKDIKDLFEKLKNEIDTKKIKYTKTEEDNLFNKNNSCISLTDTLEKKLSKDEELNFIFYSPTTKSCLFVATNKYRYSSGSYMNNNYVSYGYDTLKIYNSDGQSEIGSYIIAYSSDYPHLSKEKAEAAASANKASFIKYILENSNYNVDLLKDTSFYFSF